MATPVSHLVWAVSVTVCGALIVAWLTLGEYTRRARVQGQISPTGGYAKVKSRSAGEVSMIMVTEGSTVRAGQPLILLSTDRYTDAPEGLSTKLNSTLASQDATLKSDVKNTGDSFVQESLAISDQISIIKRQINNAQKALAIYQSEALQQSGLLKRMQPLQDQGYVSAVQIQQQRSSVASAETSVASQMATLLSLEQQLKEKISSRNFARIEKDLRLNETNRQIAKTKAEIDRNEADRGNVLRSPISGVVSNLLVRPGQSLSAGAPVVTILQSSQLEAELFVASSAIGFVKPGSVVAIQYQSFPFQKFGVYKAQVSSVSSSPILPSEIAEILGTDVGEGLYRVRAKLENQNVTAFGRSYQLTPGMKVTADIMLEKRNIYEWLFEPVFSVKKSVQEQ